MANDFYGDTMQWLQQTNRDAKAWLGALQFVVYARPERKKSYSQIEAEHYGDEKEKPSADGWFEAVSKDLEGALTSAESALSHQWQKRKDSRYDAQELGEQFAHGFEENVARIANIVLKASADIDDGIVLPNANVRNALAVVKDDLREMIDIYTEHCYEMTCSSKADNLLAIRATIVDGDSRAL